MSSFIPSSDLIKALTVFSGTTSLIPGSRILNFTSFIFLYLFRCLDHCATARRSSKSKALRHSLAITKEAKRPKGKVDS